MRQADCLTVARPVRWPASSSSPNAIGPRTPRRSSSPSTSRPPSRGIAQTIRDEVLKDGTIAFTSSRVTPRDGGLDVEGELDLLGVRAPIAFGLELDAGHLTGRATVKQSAWRITPYSALFGTLKVADQVDVAIDATLPKESDDG